MSLASTALIPMSGIAVRGSIAGGSSNHRTRLSGVFGSTPPTYARKAMPFKGGPTLDVGPLIPSMVWHATHPYSATSIRPRVISAPANWLACPRGERGARRSLQPASNKRAIAPNSKLASRSRFGICALHYSWIHANTANSLPRQPGGPRPRSRGCRHRMFQDACKFCKIASIPAKRLLRKGFASSRPLRRNPRQRTWYGTCFM